MSECAPNVEQVKTAWHQYALAADAMRGFLRDAGDNPAEEFDRFIANIKAEALENAAAKIDQIHSYGELPSGAIREEYRKEYWAFTEMSKANWLRIRAKQLREGL